MEGHYGILNSVRLLYGDDGGRFCTRTRRLQKRSHCLSISSPILKIPSDRYTTNTLKGQKHVYKPGPLIKNNRDIAVQEQEVTDLKETPLWYVEEPHRL